MGLNWGLSSIFHALAKVPGSPEAVTTAVKGGVNGDLSWNPYGSEAGVGDVVGGGTQLSQNPRARDIGRAVGTVAGGYFAAPLLAGGAGEGAAALGEAGGYGAGVGAADGAVAIGEAGGYGAGMGASGVSGGVSAADPWGTNVNMVSGAPSSGGQWINGVNNGSLVQGAGVLGSALLQSQANNNAIQAQRDAAAQQNALQKTQYDQTRADNAPWMAAGQSALAKLTGLLQDGSLSSRFAGKLDNEPGYQFALNEGMKSIDRKAAAGGGYGAGSQQAGIKYAEGTANQFYNDAFNRWNTENNGTFNRLSGLAGTGQVANSQVGQAGTNYANQSGNALLGLGDANAASGIRQGNIYGNALNQGIGLGNQYNWWQDARQNPLYDNYKNPGG
jgi:hypothetical protein